MKQTKEELQKQIGIFENTIKRLAENNESLRKEFAKAFGWYDQKSDYDYRFNRQNNETRLPSWEEIFVKLGKLLANKDFYDLEGNVSELECKFEDFEKRLLKNVNPNL